MKYLLDISDRGSEYLSEIYYRNGKLKAPISGFVNPLSVLQPVDFDYDRVLELMAFQKIAGRYNAEFAGGIYRLSSNGSDKVYLVIDAGDIWQLRNAAPPDKDSEDTLV
jgi:hypothetical protein